MHIARSIVAVFLIVHAALLPSPCAEGQQSNGALPTSLPIGNIYKMLDYMVSNAAYPDFSLTFSSTTNSYEYYDRSYGGVLHFSSYANFEECIVTNCWYLYTNDVVKRTDITSPIGLFVSVQSWPTVPNSGLILLTNNIGNLGSITTNSFLGLTNAINRLRPPIIVTNLSQFTVTVDSNPSYTYTWPAPPPPTSPYPREWTTTNVVILNQWYGMGQYRARFTISANGQTQTYTQFGDPVTNATLAMNTPSSVTISMANGSDTTLEMSTNLVQWDTVTNLPWSLGTNRVSIPVGPVLPKAFFRANS